MKATGRTGSSGKRQGNEAKVVALAAERYAKGKSMNKGGEGTWTNTRPGTGKIKRS